MKYYFTSSQNGGFDKKSSVSNLLLLFSILQPDEKTSAMEIEVNKLRKELHEVVRERDYYTVCVSICYSFVHFND